jgi:hypothetical protein
MQFVLLDAGSLAPHMLAVDVPMHMIAVGKCLDPLRRANQDTSRRLLALLSKSFHASRTGFMSSTCVSYGARSSLCAAVGQ